MGTLLLPAGFCSFWTVSFGHAAHKIAANDNGHLYGVIESNFANSLFEFVQSLPLSSIMGPLTVFILVGFFVTSLDSGSLVIAIISSKGNQNPPIWQRIFWALMEGALAAILLLAGGLQALQAGSLLSAIPFGIIMLILAWSLIATFIKVTKRPQQVSKVLEREKAQVELT